LETTHPETQAVLGVDQRTVQARTTNAVADQPTPISPGVLATVVQPPVRRLGGCDVPIGVRVPGTPGWSRSGRLGAGVAAWVVKLDVVDGSELCEGRHDEGGHGDGGAVARRPPVQPHVGDAAADAQQGGAGRRGVVTVSPEAPVLGWSLRAQPAATTLSASKTEMAGRTRRRDMECPPPFWGRQT
jgi:hypothetical protein